MSIKNFKLIIIVRNMWDYSFFNEMIWEILVQKKLEWWYFSTCD